MRLLQRKKRDVYKFTKDFQDHEIPSYAILSHTWGDSEVTFEEFAAGTACTKEGYKKIKFCGEQAALDGLEYFWIDTCCINKSVPAELSESITSMFRWYQRAARCYVYLSDLSFAGTEDSAWRAVFRKSRWHTRCWTLQELLAPDSVEFFSQEGRRLSDKRSLVQDICTVSKIPARALQGDPLSHFSYDERMSWAAGRKATKIEDEAYCLLGILSIYIPPLYGEREHAMTRLKQQMKAYETGQEQVSSYQQKLRVTNPRDDKTRIVESKGGLLKDSYHWILQNTDYQQWFKDPQSSLLCIRGDPGKGKTMLLCGIIDTLQNEQESNLSYFFFQATDNRINNHLAALRSLMYMLIECQPPLISYVQREINQAGEDLFKDVNAWFALSRILIKMLQDPLLKRTYLIVDALDECQTGLDQLLHLITQLTRTSPTTKWIISSRNCNMIEQGLYENTQKVPLSLELNQDSVSAAVQNFIVYKVNKLTEQKGYDNELRSSVQRYLRLNSNDTFLWVALVCQELAKADVQRRHTTQMLGEFPTGLDALYRRMMSQIDRSRDANDCKSILGLVTTTYRPLTLSELALLKFPNYDLEDLKDIVCACGSFLVLQGESVNFIHQSAKDFILEKVKDQIFPQGIQAIHDPFFSRSIQVLSKTLCQRDIYGLGHPGVLATEVTPPQPDPLAAITYSCIYWVDHLCEYINHRITEDNLQQIDSIDRFLRQHYLYWVEAISLLGKIPEGIVAMIKLDALFQNYEGPTATLIHDSRRFIQHNKGAIEAGPLQTYASALVFSPRQSIVRKLFSREEPGWISQKPAVEDNWSACLSTLEGHSSWVNSVAFSPDGQQIVSGSEDNTVKIWDRQSGVCVSTLKGHSESINSVAFSPDGQQIVSGSADHTVKIWDRQSGVCVSTLEGHSGPVHSVVFSPNGQQIVSGSCDYTVKVWDWQSGVCVSTLEGHSSWVNSVAFSPDGQQILSGSEDNTVKIWDRQSGVCVSTLEGHSESVHSVAFSSDGQQIVSGSEDHTVKVWDRQSGVCVSTLEGHSSWVNSVAFSPDGQQIVSGSADRTVKIWNWQSGICVSTLKGHSESVNSVAFLPDGQQIVSGSGDRTVKIWDWQSGVCISTLEGHSSWVNSVAFSPDGQQIVSGSADRTVKIWNWQSGVCVPTLEGHSRWIHSVASIAGYEKTWDINQPWITWKGKTILWLPSGYRPETFAVHSNMLFIGCKSGRVWKIEFLPDELNN